MLKGETPKRKTISRPELKEVKQNFVAYATAIDDDPVPVLDAFRGVAVLWLMVNGVVPRKNTHQKRTCTELWHQRALWADLRSSEDTLVHM